MFVCLPKQDSISFVIVYRFSSYLLGNVRRHLCSKVYGRSNGIVEMARLRLECCVYNLRVDEFALKFVDGAESEGECE